MAVVLDVFSRRVVGWATSSRLDRELALAALSAALAARRPEPGLLHHSDRGAQYCSRDYRQRLEAEALVSSMSRRGDCFDNALAESFFKTLKTELGGHFPTRELARRAIFDYIEAFYNTRRLHSALGYRSPADYERLARRAAQAAPSPDLGGGPSRFAARSLAPAHPRTTETERITL